MQRDGKVEEKYNKETRGSIIEESLIPVSEMTCQSLEESSVLQGESKVREAVGYGGE